MCCIMCDTFQTGEPPTAQAVGLCARYGADRLSGFFFQIHRADRLSGLCAIYRADRFKQAVELCARYGVDR